MDGWRDGTVGKTVNGYGADSSRREGEEGEALHHDGRFLGRNVSTKKSPRCVRPIMAIHILHCSEASVPYIGDAFPTTQLRSCDGATALRRYGPFRGISTDRMEGTYDSGELSRAGAGWIGEMCRSRGKR